MKTKWKMCRRTGRKSSMAVIFFSPCATYGFSATVGNRIRLNCFSPTVVRLLYRSFVSDKIDYYSPTKTWLMNLVNNANLLSTTLESGISDYRDGSSPLWGGGARVECWFCFVKGKLYHRIPLLINAFNIKFTFHYMIINSDFPSTFPMSCLMTPWLIWIFIFALALVM